MLQTAKNNRKETPMIIDHKIGDITNPNNPDDIIIGMNDTVDDLRGFSVPYATSLRREVPLPLTLGTVFSFDYRNSRRKLHMLICHKIGFGGWENAAEYVRFAMDYLNHQNRLAQIPRNFSIVPIGTGEIGRRDEANHVSIHTAIATSHLPVTMYIRGDKDHRPVPLEMAPLELVARAYWNPSIGERRISIAA